jgi:Ser/Thr protein kinase RdoA (MazF antagonist)
MTDSLMTESSAYAHPYARLTPDRVLDALESAGFRGDGRMIPLNSYENRVYQVYLEDGTVVVPKFYRPERWTDAQILEEHAFAIELAGHEIPVVAPLDLSTIASALIGPTLAQFEGYRFAVYPRRGGRAPELDDAKTLEWIGRFIARIHAVGAVAPFRARPALDIASFGDESRDYLLGAKLVPPELVEAYTVSIDLALAGVRRAFDRAGKVESIRLHGDCHVGNILWTTDGPHFVDFDDARMGPRMQDLWMLLSGDRASMQRQLTDVLIGYEDFQEFDPRELHLLEALRTLRLIQYSAWIARRWNDPAFPAAFPWFNTQRYWQDRVLELREQIAALDEPPLVA